MMRVLVPVLLVVAAAVAVVLLTRDGEEPYQVRAIFDNAGFVIPGEDVKVAGVKVGKIDALDVTDDFKAVVVLDIADEAYQDFRRDAECTIRPQSLIGEKFVECEPTQARQASAPEEPALEKIEDGPGKGQYLLPVENTSKPVDLDLLNNITREPQRARLSIILNELGTGVAGRGSDLNEVIRRANPALKEVDKVLAILASENDTLQKLAVDGDTVLAPLARERRRVSSALEQLRRGGGGHRRAPRRAGGRHRAAARVPARAAPDDGAPRRASPTRRRRCSPTSATQAPAINRFADRSSGRSRRPASRRSTRSATRPRSASRRSSAARPIIRDLRVLAKEVRPARRAPRAAVLALAPVPSAASSASWTTSSTKWPPSTASTRSATTCAPG